MDLDWIPNTDNCHPSLTYLRGGCPHSASPPLGWGGGDGGGEGRGGCCRTLTAYRHHAVLPQSGAGGHLHDNRTMLRREQ